MQVVVVGARAPQRAARLQMVVEQCRLCQHRCWEQRQLQVQYRGTAMSCAPPPRACVLANSAPPFFEFNKVIPFPPPLKVFTPSLREADDVVAHLLRAMQFRARSMSVKMESLM